ncbi:phosphatidylserine decarboxylase-domain-containing protein [Aspergillus aurantiobrunneus]
MFSTVATTFNTLFTQHKTESDDYAPLVQQLQHWITSDPSHKQDFELAIHTAHSHNTAEMQNMRSLEDYLHFIEEQLHWIPSESVQAKDLLNRTATTWFVLDQPSVLQYQTPVRPTMGEQHQQSEKLTWLSNWMVRYSNEMGLFMDTPASAAKLDTFRSSPSYNIEDYVEPRGGWRTFNEFFSRHLKPGRRPIAAVGDSLVLTSPADFEFKELHVVSESSTVTTKGLTWPIGQMLRGSPYKDRFANGVWLHGFLNVDDYHRVHTPVSGTVLEARTIQGQSYMQVEAAEFANGASLTVPNEAGYQFCQSRGLIIVDTGFGLVAVLPVGMAIVSSVILTAETGIRLRKGEELGYFQFGGSDVVLLFEACLNVEISMRPGQHYKMGMEIGRFNV